jgi:hypothetical protein
MVEFEAVALGTAATVLSNIRALSAIAGSHGALDRGRDVARRRRRIGLFKALPRRLRAAKSSRFEPLELFGHRILDNGYEVSVRHR